MYEERRVPKEKSYNAKEQLEELRAYLQSAECDVSKDRTWSGQYSCGVHGVTFRSSDEPVGCPVSDFAVKALQAAGLLELKEGDVKDGICKHCAEPKKESECFEHCHEHMSGKHTPNWPRATFADDLPTDGVVVDVPCIWCGVTASAKVAPEDISWG